MKRILLLFIMVSLILMVGSLSVQAALVQSDIFDPVDNWTNPNDPSDVGTKIKPSNPSYPAVTFDLNLIGYTPGTDLTKAELKLNLADDSSFFSNVGAGVTISLQGGGGDILKEFIIDGTRKDYLVDISDGGILADLTSGSLSFTLGITPNGDEKNNADFIFHNAQMNAETVPIPSAVLLLGSGLVGLAGIRRRGFKK